MSKVLVVEDNNEMRENIAEILELSGYTVITAPDGKQGVEMAVGNEPDIIICDIMMPELDGFGVLRILSKNPATANTPFIFLTAKAEKEDFRRGMGLGADDYIIKPFDDVDLLNTIEMRLNKSRKLRESFDGSEEGVRRFLNEAKAREQMQELTEGREARVYRRKDVLYSEGQTARWLFFLSSGRVKCAQMNEMGKEFITHIQVSGDFLGYIPLISEEPYANTAVALEDTEVLLIPKDDFLKLLHSSREISATLVKMLASQVAETEAHLLQLAYGSVREKVAHVLKLLYDKNTEGENEEVRISVLREDLAGMAGIAKETVIRTLSDFKDEGLIYIDHNDIVISDINTLLSRPY